MDKLNTNRLIGTRTYLAGPMDRVPDMGVEWRAWITPHLRNLGCSVFDPCDKPIEIANEIENREYREHLLETEQYDVLAEAVRIIRCVDLRMVDLSDFIIAYLDLDVFACGTLEEIYLANRSKKPILLHMKQGKRHTPNWLFGVMPHQHIFSSWNDLLAYLKHVHEDEEVEHYKRWWFFDYAKLQ